MDKTTCKVSDEQKYCPFRLLSNNGYELQTPCSQDRCEWSAEGHCVMHWIGLYLRQKHIDLPDFAEK